MTNYASGHLAEKYASEYLTKQGYEILAINWRTRYCEIDIVAKKAKTICFIEVKYRKSDFAGTGLDYITPIKLKQMKFAAEMWVQENNWSGDYSLGAIEISGEDYRITNFLFDIS